MQTETRRRWPRLTLVLPPERAAALRVIAEGNFRDQRREALRLLTEAIDREHAQQTSR